MAVSLVARLVLAAVLGLGVDESYEVVLSRVPSLGYFDHPPLSFWIPGFMAWLTGSEQRVLLRLPFILIFAATTILMYRLTARLYGDRAGFFASMLLNLSPVFSISTGGWILPDGPLACAILAATLCLTRVLLEPPSRAWPWWIGAGVATGLALLSKYHGVLLPVGTLLFMVTCRPARFWFRRPEPYVAAAISIAIAMPVIIWNAQHDFASLRFQAGRATTHGVHLAALAQNIAGQLGYLLPWIGVPLLWQLIRGLRGGPGDGSRWLLCCLAVWPIALFTLISLGGNPGLPHWPAPGYLLLFPLVGDAIARYESCGTRERMSVVRGLAAAGVVFVLFVAVAASDVSTGWIVRVAPRLFERGDPSLEAYDWSDVRGDLTSRKLLAPGDIVVATHWIDAAKLGYALGPSVPVVCLSDDPRGFQFTYPPERFLGRDAIILVRIRSGARSIDVPARYGTGFASIAPLDTISLGRAGRVEIELAAFRARGLRPSHLRFDMREASSPTVIQDVRSGTMIDLDTIAHRP
ncbi:MAG TPA: glycosyltransferase family 39 protein [Gemmatimonadaceae bacterium]